jgi:hypothetical protein
MTHTLTWDFLSPAHMARIRNSSDAPAIHALLLDADEGCGGRFFGAPSDMQRKILLDLYYHVIRFAKTNGMTGEKQSTLVSIVQKMHTTAMAAKASSQDAFAILESIMISHSVHRPPYSAAVFAVDDAKLIIDFMMGSYFRHYKLYTYAFSNRSELTVTCSTLGETSEVPPVAAALMKAVPLAQWEAAQAEQQRQEEAAQKVIDDAAAADAAEEERRRLAEAAGPPMPDGLKSQLDAIRNQVGKTSAEGMEDLEQRIAALEAKLLQDANKTAATVGKGQVRAPGRK